jgi:hypothetical protein
MDTAALLDRPLWWHVQGLSYTASGYGAKIPTRGMVHYQGRDRRIYCTIYSNSGTCWIVVKGRKHIVSDDYQGNVTIAATPWGS